MKQHRFVFICIITALLLSVFLYIWWREIGRWKTLTPELLMIYSSDYSFRNENDQKTDPDLFTWYSFFKPEDFSGNLEDKSIYTKYCQLQSFDFSNYTYILSYGWTIEKLYYTGQFAEPRMRAARVLHGTNCKANEILLYRIPHIYIEPNNNRRSTYGYKFTK